jgi:opacity protein-like surface antigen
VCIRSGEVTIHRPTVGLLGYNHLNSGSPSVSDTYWWNISANLKYEFTTSPLRPYANGGPGIYIPESGSTKPGFNVGLGLDYSLTSDWIIELGADYHHVFTSGSDTQFFVPHVGLIYRF